MRADRAGLAGLLLVGLAVRLWGLPLWGTFDTEVQKAWAARAATKGLANIYGPPDRELLAAARERGEHVAVSLLRGQLPRTVFVWGQASYFVDYPPGSLLVLWLAGRGYAAVDADLANRPAFNLAINVAPLIGSIAIAVLLLRSSATHGRLRALAFWLNPAMVLAAPVLGYQDPIFGGLALAAVLALMERRPVWASALTVAAGLVKPQGALLVPCLALVLLRESPPRVWLRAAAAGLSVAVAVLLPWWSSGHLLSALDGLLRPLGQGTLAPHGLNVWWIAGYAQSWSETGPWSLAANVGIQEFRAWAGWDPVPVARTALAAVTAGILFLLWRAGPEDRSAIPLAVVLQVHAYAVLATSVHENHTLLAVMLAPLLLGTRSGAGAVVAGTSAFAFASLFLAAGLGRRITTQRWLAELRAATGLDLSVLVAALHVVLAALLLAWAARRRPAGAQPARC